MAVAQHPRTARTAADPVAERDRSAAADPVMVPIVMYTYQAGGRWYAECLTLSLLAVRETQEEALADLREQIALHVESMTALGWPIRRPVSLRGRVAFYVRITGTLFGLRRSSLVTDTITVR